MSFCVNSVLRVRKDRIEPKANETVESYRERCRKRIAEMGGFKLYDVDIKDFFSYEAEFTEKLKEFQKASKAE